MEKSKRSRQQMPTVQPPLIGTSISKDQTALTPPLSSAENRVVLAVPYRPSAKAEHLPISTNNTAKPLKPTSPAGPTLPPTDNSRKHADFARAAILQLEAAGLCQRQRVLSQDGQTVLAVRIVLDPSLWTEDLRLKV